LDSGAESVFLTGVSGAGHYIGCKERSNSVAHTEISWASTNELILKYVLENVQQSWYLYLAAHQVSKVIRVQGPEWKTNVMYMRHQ